jgi:hypothetical protein
MIHADTDRAAPSRLPAEPAARIMDKGAQPRMHSAVAREVRRSGSVQGGAHGDGEMEGVKSA